MPRVPAFVTVLGCLAAVCCNGSSRGVTPEIGTDLYAVAPEGVSEVSLSSKGQRMWAYKWATSESFSLVFAYRSPPHVETCMAGSRFRSWLRTVSRLHITGTPRAPIDRASPDWVDLRIADSSALKPIDVLIYLPPVDREAPVVMVDGAQFLAEVDLVSARAIWSGCAKMSP